MAEIKDITREVVDLSKELYGPLLSRILLYGSYARGDFNNQSDVDIMIVLDCDDEDLKRFRKGTSRMASRVGLKNDIEVSLLLRDKRNFEARQSILPFYDRVQREGIVLYG